MDNFQPLGVVSRGSETPLQVGENLNYLIERFNRQIIQFEFSPTWVKIIQIWQNGGHLFSNIADWCHILSLTCSKGGT